MISFMRVASMIEQQPAKKWIAVKMVNALKKDMMEKIAVKKVQTKWIAVKMANAQKRGMMERIVAKRKEWHKWRAAKTQVAVKNHDLFLN